MWARSEWYHDSRHGWEMRYGDLRARVTSIRTHGADFAWDIIRIAHTFPDFADLGPGDFEELFDGDTVGDGAEEQAKRDAALALRIIADREPAEPPKPSPNVLNGPALRVMRNTLGLTQEQMARVLFCRGEAICRWESQADELSLDRFHFRVLARLRGYLGHAGVTAVETLGRRLRNAQGDDLTMLLELLSIIVPSAQR